MLEIDYAATSYTHANEDDRPSKIEVYIDDVLVSETPVTNDERSKIVIDMNNFPQLNHNKGYYKVSIITNGSFNPKKYGWSEDNRELALRLFEIRTTPDIS
jgi:hypothetical protein